MPCARRNIVVRCPSSLGLVVFLGMLASLHAPSYAQPRQELSLLHTVGHDVDAVAIERSTDLKGPMAAKGWAEIRVIDSATGRGVPLVELETVNGVKFVTDNAGRVAFQEPEW